MYFSLRSKVYEIRDTVDVNAYIDNFSRKKSEFYPCNNGRVAVGDMHCSSTTAKSRMVVTNFIITIMIVHFSALSTLFYVCKDVRADSWHRFLFIKLNNDFEQNIYVCVDISPNEVSHEKKRPRHPVLFGRKVYFNPNCTCHFQAHRKNIYSLQFSWLTGEEGNSAPFLRGNAGTYRDSIGIH